MTCQELESHFESISMRGAEASADADQNEHLANCAKCTRFVETQKQLHTSLALLRESAPAASFSLDAVVLTNYRKQVLDPRSSATAKVRKPTFTLRWGLAVTAALVLCAILVWPRKQPSGAVTSRVTPHAAISSAQLHYSQIPPIPQSVSRTKGTRHAAKRVSASLSSSNLSTRMPDGFRSLMYCDELSCGGAMDVLRIQLPPSAIGLMTAEPSGNVVSADVLVGADGIARGIRIVR